MSDVWLQSTTLIDPDSRAEESVGYFEGPHGPLYGVFHRAARNTGQAVVVVSPFMLEFQRNYRREVLVARSLAARGVDCLRFSFAGQGHSGGDTSALSWDSAVADTLRAADHLRRLSDVEELTVVGTRTGGLVGAAAAKDSGATRMVVCAPLLTGAAWVRELGRAARVQAMRDPGSDQRLLAERVEADGRADVFGIMMPGRLYDDFADRALATELPDSIGSLLMVEYGPKTPKKLEEAAADLRERGVSVDLATIPEEEGWWASHRADYFVGETSRLLTRELIPLVTDWVAA